jgi:hypothetical protein
MHMRIYICILWEPVDWSGKDSFRAANRISRRVEVADTLARESEGGRIDMRRPSYKDWFTQTAIQLSLPPAIDQDTQPSNVFLRTLRPRCVLLPRIGPKILRADVDVRSRGVRHEGTPEGLLLQA